MKDRLPTNIKTLKPDCKKPDCEKPDSITLAEWSSEPKDWLLNSTGICFTFDAKKALVTSIFETSSESESSSESSTEDDFLKKDSVEVISPSESGSQKQIDEKIVKANV